MEAGNRIKQRKDLAEIKSIITQPGFEGIKPLVPIAKIGSADTHPQAFKDLKNLKGLGTLGESDYDDQAAELVHEVTEGLKYAPVQDIAPKRSPSDDTYVEYGSAIKGRRLSLGGDFVPRTERRSSVPDLSTSRSQLKTPASVSAHSTSSALKQTMSTKGTDGRATIANPTDGSNGTIIIEINKTDSQ